MTDSNLTRRGLLARSGVVAGAALLASVTGSVVLSTPAYADSSATTPTGEDIRKALRRYETNRGRVRSGKPSPNGWEMEKKTDGGGSIWTRPVPGTPLDGVTVRIGEVEAVLVHVIRRFHYEIDQLRKGEVTGWRSPGKVRKGLPEGNQASGTAVQIRPEFYPAGTTGGFFPPQLLVIRDILAELDGVVRWGGDDRKADESLFYIDVKPGDPRLAALVEKLRTWQDTPSEGAGTPVDVLADDRRRAAKALQRSQRS
ncbi:hypothetical protein ACFW5I_03380 [Streptomyces sp. NPDC058818]|uniref:hypothetical protein n=1 Tax=Streptomyces sp. NPDC058818 TaxID=3346640 RepID=UPI003682853D